MSFDHEAIADRIEAATRPAPISLRYDGQRFELHPGELRNPAAIACLFGSDAAGWAREVLGIHANSEDARELLAEVTAAIRPTGARLTVPYSDGNADVLVASVASSRILASLREGRLREWVKLLLLEPPRRPRVADAKALAQHLADELAPDVGSAS